MDRINFTGGFLLVKPKPEVWESAYNKAIPRSARNIVYDLYNEGNIFVVIKNCYDGDVLRYFIDKKIDFKYYPKVNTKNQFDRHNPEAARKILDSQDEVLTGDDTNALEKYMKFRRFRDKQLNYSRDTHTKKAFKVLGINENNFNVDTKNYITSITDKDGRLVAIVSPNDHRGINYVIAYPRYSDEDLTMYKIDFNGNILEKSTDINRLILFKRDFMKNVNGMRNPNHRAI